MEKAALGFPARLLWFWVREPFYARVINEENRYPLFLITL